MPEASALRDRIEQALSRPVEVLARAPGRLNVIGEHTDYIGGLSLPAAIDRSIMVGLHRSAEGITLHSLDAPGTWTTSLDTPLRPHTLPADAPDWVRYMLGSIAVFVAHVAGPEQPPSAVLQPFTAAVAGDVPTGAGLSSSAALTVAWMNALAGWADHALAPTTIIALARQVEHQWLGVQCGALDQTASQMGRDGHLLMVDFQPEPLSATPVRAALSDTVWLVLHTGVQRGLAHSEYSARVQAVTDGLARVQARHPQVQHWRDLTLDHVAALEATEPLMARRLRHGVTENARVVSMVHAIQHDGPRTVGALLNQSHASLRDDYAVSCPELDTMCTLANELSEVWGARMVGAGFGGCVLALAQADLTDAMLDQMLEVYHQRTGLRGTAYRMSPGPGAERLV